jgi:hypothetical protein
LPEPVHRSLPKRYVVAEGRVSVETNDGWPPHEFALILVPADHVPRGDVAVTYERPVPLQ